MVLPSSLMSHASILLSKDTKGPSVEILAERIAALRKLYEEESSTGKPSGATKRDLIRASKLLTVALQSPGEIADGYKCREADFALAKTALDLGVLQHLSKSSVSKSTSELASESGCDEFLLGRILSGLASDDAVHERDIDLWEANKVTRALVSTKGSSSLDLHHDLVNLAVEAVPRFLNERDAFSTEDNMFAWVARPDHTKLLESFNVYMDSQRDGYTFWCDFFPFETLLEGYKALEGSGILLIDIGGAAGQVLRSVHERYPDLPKESLLLQDLRGTIANIPPTAPFKSMAYDFFEPQPVKGVRAYYMRNVLHDWPDDRCQQILTNVKGAMKRGYSKLLINELAVPNKGADYFSTHMDIMMLSLVAGKERTVIQWEELLHSVGLEVEKIWQNDSDGEALIVATL